MARERALYEERVPCYRPFATHDFATVQAEKRRDIRHGITADDILNEARDKLTDKKNEASTVSASARLTDKQLQALLCTDWQPCDLAQEQADQAQKCLPKATAPPEDPEGVEPVPPQKLREACSRRNSAFTPLSDSSAFLAGVLDRRRLMEADEAVSERMASEGGWPMADGGRAEGTPGEGQGGAWAFRGRAGGCSTPSRQLRATQSEKASLAQRISATPDARHPSEPPTPTPPAADAPPLPGSLHFPCLAFDKVRSGLRRLSSIQISSTSADLSALLNRAGGLDAGTGGAKQTADRGGLSTPAPPPPAGDPWCASVAFESRARGRSFDEGLRRSLQEARPGPPDRYGRHSIDVPVARATGAAGLDGKRAGGGRRGSVCFAGSGPVPDVDGMAAPSPPDQGGGTPLPRIGAGSPTPGRTRSTCRLQLEPSGATPAQEPDGMCAWTASVGRRGAFDSASASTEAAMRLRASHRLRHVSSVTVIVPDGLGADGAYSPGNVASPSPLSASPSVHASPQFSPSPASSPGPQLLPSPPGGGVAAPSTLRTAMLSPSYERGLGGSYLPKA